MCLCFDRHTYLEQDKGETPNDFNDRCIRRVAAFYNTKAEEEKTAMGQEEDIHTIIFLTNDRENLRKAEEEKLRSYSGLRFYLFPFVM